MSNNPIAVPATGRVSGVQIRIVAVVVLGAFLALLNQTVMSPALPVIMADFAIDASAAQWIMSIYPLVSGIMVPVSAFLSISSAHELCSLDRPLYLLWAHYCALWLPIFSS